jgi:tRNA pseudouridine38-40 synthase
MRLPKNLLLKSGLINAGWKSRTYAATFESMKVFKATIAYDGTDFSGVAEQVTKDGEAKIRTVVGELRPVIEMVAQSVPVINVSGRTDKGVHALEQVISFSFPDNPDVEIDVDRLAYVCNKRLNPEIVISSCEEAQEDFHARFSAKSRTYRYFIDTNESPNIFSSRFAWHVGKELDVEAMNVAAKLFVGEKDFTSVCKQDDSMPHNIREVFSAEIIDADNAFGKENQLLCFQISANAFCWNMVRSIVGVLVDVGLGKIAPEDVQSLLDAKKRDSSRTFAPAHGLTLWNVQY